MNKIRFILVILGILMLIFGTVLLYEPTEEPSSASLVNTTYLNSMPQYDRSGIYIKRLKPELLPPTNTWFSGAVLQKKPKAVFPTPLSFYPKDNSFEIGLPSVKVTEGDILGPHVGDIYTEIVGSSEYRVVYYDDLSFDIEYRNSSGALGTAKITAGSPYIYYHANLDTKLKIKSSGDFRIEGKEAQAVIGNKVAGMSAGNKASLNKTANGLTAIVPENDFVTFYISPVGYENEVKKYTLNRLETADSTFRLRNGRFNTDIKLKTSNNKPTLIAYLPHHDYSGNSAARFETIYGPAKMTSGLKFSFSTKKLDAKRQLDLNNLNKADKELLITMLRRDINATKLGIHEDTYSAGKSLYRAAQLLELANQLDQPLLADSIELKLHAELSEWLSSHNGRSSKYFYYDKTAKSIVGERTAFGSEEINDHHFHYGYIIYSASILSLYNENFSRENKDIVNLLVADIANYKDNDALPKRRVFSPYFGHSWASGTAPFDDGNNQESSSEAINAWVACALWADVIDDEQLALHASWMLSIEAEAARQYWLNFDMVQAPYNQGYSKPVVSLNWGGKRNFSTFFSDEPNAIIGIQLIPMNPTMTQLNIPTERISRTVKVAIKSGNYNVALGDYIAMYGALSKSGTGIDVAKSIPDEQIDSANSRSYMLAWFLAQEIDNR